MTQKIYAGAITALLSLSGTCNPQRDSERIRHHDGVLIGERRVAVPAPRAPGNRMPSAFPGIADPKRI